jgi:hypothetical protein
MTKSKHVNTLILHKILIKKQAFNENVVAGKRTESGHSDIGNGLAILSHWI